MGKKYSFICNFCGNVIKTSFKKQKFCNNNCYHKSEQFNKMISDNGKKLKGCKRKEYRISYGYKYIFMPEHPYANDSRYVAEHRLIMEKKLKRYLFPNEVVHHINGNKQDNKIENLQLTTFKEHAFIHSKKGVPVSHKLSIEDVKKIRLSDKSNLELSKIYNVHKATIWNIKVNKTWKQ